MSGMPELCEICPFIGDVYTVRCPLCMIIRHTKYSDGAALRVRPLWKTCEVGHKFLVSLDASIPFDRVAFVDGSDYAHPLESSMESSKKKQRSGPSRTECMTPAEKVRHIMGLVPPRDARKARPQMLVMPGQLGQPGQSGQPGQPAPPACVMPASPPTPVALAMVVSAPEEDSSSTRPAKVRRLAYDEEDEDVDIDAALRTMDDIAAESAAAEFCRSCA